MRRRVLLVLVAAIALAVLVATVVSLARPTEPFGDAGLIAPPSAEPESPESLLARGGRQFPESRTSESLQTHVRLLDCETGVPIQGVLTAPREAALRVRARDDGSYEAQIGATGELLRAEAEGYQPAEQFVRPSAETVTIRLCASRALRVIVRDATTHGPIASAEVRVVSGAHVVWRQQTDSEGRVTVSAKDTPAVLRGAGVGTRVVAAASGYVPSSYAFLSPATTEILLILDPALGLVVRVERVGGTPIAGATVTSLPPASANAGALPIAEARTGPDGSCTIPAVLATRMLEGWRLLVSAAGYPVTLFEGTTDTNPTTLTLHEAASGTVRLVAPGGAALSGVTVSITVSTSDGTAVEVVTGDDGVATIQGVIATADYVLVARRAGEHLGRTLVSGADLIRAATWSLANLRALTVSVKTRAGLPVRGCALWEWNEASGATDRFITRRSGRLPTVTPQTAWTDAQGVATLRVSESRARLVAVATGYAVVSAMAEAGADRLEVVLHESSSVELEIVDGDDAPIAGAYVTVLPSLRPMGGDGAAMPHETALEVVQRVTTGRDGKASILALSSQQVLSVVAGESVRSNIPLTSSDIIAGTLRIRLRRSEHLGIRVVDADGAAIPGAVVAVNVADLDSAPGAFPISGDDGAVRVVLPIPSRPADPVRFTFFGGATGVSIVPRNQLWEGATVAARRRELEPLIVELVGNELGSDRVPVVAAYEGSASAAASGYAQAGQRLELLVPSGVALDLIVGCADGPPHIVPIGAKRKATIRMPMRKPILVQNRSQRFVELQVTAYSTSVAWFAPPLAPGAEQVVSIESDTETLYRVHDRYVSISTWPVETINSKESQRVQVSDNGFSVD